LSNNRIVIEPGTIAGNYWKDLWKYRGLFYFLAWRDILVRYKQTSIGIAWSVLRPLLTIFAFTFIGWLFKVDTHGTPRVLLVAAATLPWQFFSSAFSDASNSLISNSNLISKIYFPRLIVPASTVIVCLIDFLISFVIIVALMAVFHQVPSINIIFLPLFLLLAIVSAMGVGLWMAALNVKYRDFKYVVPFVIQVGYYISPLIYSSQEIYNHTGLPDWIKYTYSLNPMVGIIDGFRWSLLGGDMQIHWVPFSISVGISLLFLIIGIVYFRKMEKDFADVI